MENTKEDTTNYNSIGVIDHLFTWKLWDTLNNAAGGIDCWGVHNKTLYYSNSLNDYKTKKTMVAKDGSLFSSVMELVIQFQKDYTMEGTPVFVVPLTEELRDVLVDMVGVKSAYAYSQYDNDNVIVYTKKNGQLFVSHTSWIEVEYYAPAFMAFRSMMDMHDGEDINMRPDNVI